MGTVADAALAATPSGAGEAAADPVRWLRLLHWGLVPSWAHYPFSGNYLLSHKSQK